MLNSISGQNLHCQKPGVSFGLLEIRSNPVKIQELHKKLTNDAKAKAAGLANNYGLDIAEQGMCERALSPISSTDDKLRVGISGTTIHDFADRDNFDKTYRCRNILNDLILYEKKVEKEQSAKKDVKVVPIIDQETLKEKLDFYLHVNWLDR